VASETSNFFMMRLHTTLQVFLGGTVKLASRLDAFLTTETCGIPARLNLE
jgi:hypothetical protein